MIPSYLFAACLLVGPVRSEHVSIVYQEDISRVVEMRILDAHHVGKLDANGYLRILETITPSGFAPTGRFVLNKVPYDNLTFQRRESPEVYQLLDGKLTLGTFRPDGMFTEKLSTKPVEFKDYRYSPDTPPIYNLPGKFVVKIDLSQLAPLR
ncbi:MAG: hypothetical protein ACRC8S_09985 [Fimbriiglobus sp.]